MKTLWKSYGKYFPTLVIVVLILVILIGGGNGYRYHKRSLKTQISKKDSTIAVIQSQKDSAMSVATRDYLKYVDSEAKLGQLRNANRKLYATIKTIENRLAIIDTGFMVNARRISESSDRFYKE